METLPYTVIGGGICGVMTALKLKQKWPEADVVLIEKEPFIGHHNTTRNSGVLHAGIYYPNGSFKHTLCRDGLEQWSRLSLEMGIAANICGKYVVASDESQLSYLENVYMNAQKNGVKDLRKMTAEDFTEISPYTHAVAGFFSPHTGILDISAGINILRDEFVQSGGIVMMNCEVRGLKSEQERIQVTTSGDEFLTRHVFNCGGAWAVDLRKMLGFHDVENQFVKGNYLKFNQPYYNRRLIYPVPQKNLTGLGVHTSFHIDGIVRFGPNTENVTNVEYSNREDNIDIMYPAIRATFKNIDRNIEKTDLSLDYVGVRTKIVKNGQLYTDFLLQGPKQLGLSGYHEALGIESPGMTAAPAIADWLIQDI